MDIIRIVREKQRKDESKKRDIKKMERVIERRRVMNSQKQTDMREIMGWGRE